MSWPSVSTSSCSACVPEACQLCRTAPSSSELGCSRAIHCLALGPGSRSGKFGADVVQDRPLEGSEGVVCVERGMAGRDDQECTGTR